MTDRDKKLVSEFVAEMIRQGNQSYSKDTPNYWPLAIVITDTLFLIALSVMLFWTHVSALKNAQEGGRSRRFTCAGCITFAAISINPSIAPPQPIIAKCGFSLSDTGLDGCGCARHSSRNQAGNAVLRLAAVAV